MHVGESDKEDEANDVVGDRDFRKRMNGVERDMVEWSWELLFVIKKKRF